MSNFTSQQFEEVLDEACAWAEEQEREILRSGIPLSDSQHEDAKRIGVAQPDRVRLLMVQQIPSPTDPPLLAKLVKDTNVISPRTDGLTVRYGIFIRNESRQNRSLIAHELAHTKQYEVLGGFKEFLRPYLLECINPPGYPHGPLEQEAIRIQGEFSRFR